MIAVSARCLTPLFLAAAAACTAQAAAAQAAADHAAHHPGDATPAAGTQSSPVPTQGMAGPPGSMPAQMDEMMGSEMQRGKQASVYSVLLRLPELDQRARVNAAAEANARLHRGLNLANEATSEAHGPGQPDGAAIARQLREAAALIESGSATTAVLDGRRSGAEMANNWFRSEMGLTPLDPHATMPGMLWGLGPGHWLFMATTLLMLAALLVLQMLRLRRVRALVAPGANQHFRTMPKQAANGPQLRSPDVVPAQLAKGPDRPSVARPARWSGDLRVAQIFAETPSVKTFRLVLPGADRLPFDFLPGQFLQVEVPKGDGTKAKRSYTIASSPTQRAYVEVTVKREAQGVVSRYLHDEAKSGDLVRIAGPFGHFTFTGTDAESIVLIAGGVGITPMMSVLRFLTDTAWPGEIFFVYAARSTDEFVFRTEIEQLERRHPNLTVFAAMERAPGTVWHGAEGHITRALLESAVPEIAKRRIHLCGPPPMMVAMRDILTQIGVPDAQIFSEAFGPASLPIDEPVLTDQPTGTGQDAAPSEPSPTMMERPPIAATTVTFSVAGVSAPLDPNETILEAAETAGVEIPYSCRVGECGVCVTRLLEGEVTMEVEGGLDPADKAQGYVLACQARCTRGPLVVEA